MSKYLLISSILILVLLGSCESNYSKGPAIDESKLENLEIIIHRYGKSLFQIDTLNFIEGVNNIHGEFELFIGSDISDPRRLQPLYEYVRDTQLISIAHKVIEIYPNLNELEAQLEDALSRYHYFFPGFTTPTIYSYISNMYYEKPVILDDSVLIIALDVYLGEDYDPYRSLGLPYYIIRRMNSDNIPIDVMKELYNAKLNPKHKQKTLVDRMISSGKLLYYLDAVLPLTPDSLKIGYTSKQIDWIESNKKKVWGFLVDNKLFYSADYKIQSNLIKDAPFTSGFSKDSPPRLGSWLGWQIVRKYMSNNSDITLQQLLKESDSQKIFNGSGYKP